MPKNICENSLRVIRIDEGGAEILKQPNYHADDRGTEIIKLIPFGTEVLFQVSDRIDHLSKISLAGGLTRWVKTKDSRASFDGNLAFNCKMCVKTLEGSNLNIRQSPS
ncbi:hypothetical protein [Pseudanabaena sp. BC1403]|uniref:hypothetical protein n=1 Tax=Pseudanabaena sp. BC1403 TaxID=2043171 RepID=UPI000CD8CA0D|nr:hypothetical protein [Pseudanabaena sp. BC1403]